MQFQPESLAMRICRRLGLDAIAWSLRRLHCPVGREALVLEVGSGGNPYHRANVLLDAYEDTAERYWEPLVADRPLVLGRVENLPFKDQAFDFVIASHVLEHSAHPERFLAELQRVAKAGYIEVPDALFERLNPYRYHRLEITERNGTLIIRKKGAAVVDPELVELYEHRAKRSLVAVWIPRRPFDFMLRHYWQGCIAYEILNPEVDAAWQQPPPDERAASSPGVVARLKKLGLRVSRWLLSQRRRNARIDLYELLICPACKSSHLARQEDGLRCTACGRNYPVRDGIPVMTVEDRLVGRGCA